MSVWNTLSLQRCSRVVDYSAGEVSMDILSVLYCLYVTVRGEVQLTLLYF